MKRGLETSCVHAYVLHRKRSKSTVTNKVRGQYFDVTYAKFKYTESLLM